MIISINFVSYDAGGVIFSRFYGHNLRTELQQAEWLKKMRDATAPDWPLLKEDNSEQIATVGEVQIVYKLFGDVVLMIAGVEEHDALLMLDLARSLVTTLRSACRIPENRAGEVKVSAERRLFQHYANLCMVVDEQVDDGDIDHLDSRVVLRLLRMRPTS